MLSSSELESKESKIEKDTKLSNSNKDNNNSESKKSEKEKYDKDFDWDNYWKNYQLDDDEIRCSICNRIDKKYLIPPLSGIKTKSGKRKTKTRKDICGKCQLETHLCSNGCGTPLSITTFINGHNSRLCKYAKAKLFDIYYSKSSNDEKKIIDENHKLKNQLEEMTTWRNLLRKESDYLEKNNKNLKEKYEIFSDIIQKLKTYIQSDLHPRLAQMSLSTCTACRECKQHTVDKHNCTKCRPCDNCKNTIRIVDDKIYMNDEKFNNILHS